MERVGQLRLHEGHDRVDPQQLGSCRLDRRLVPNEIAPRVPGDARGQPGAVSTASRERLRVGGAQYPPLGELLLLLLLPLPAELTGLVMIVPDGEIMYHCPPYPCPL
jgi:hypothetical protein